MASYVVKKGDTLSKIAKSNGTTVHVLMSINKNISNANVIKVGQVINLPTPATVTTGKDYKAIGKQLEKCLDKIEALPEFIALEGMLNVRD